MPFDDPSAIDLAALFRDDGMFASKSTWGAAGFEVLNRSNNGKIMVARHPTVRGLLFKKYNSDVEQKDQLRNFSRRIEGADRLRAYALGHGVSRVVVPRKWLFELPRAISRRETAHVLVVEQLDLLDDGQTRRAYEQIQLPVLGDLCTMLFHFRGMDSNCKNLPFTTDGRIAFVDTEHWDRSTSKDYLHHVGEYLSPAGRRAAEKIFDRLEDGEDVGSFGGWSEFDDEDTSPSSDSDDFDDEEDTSSSSSS